MPPREPMWYCHGCHAEMRPLMVPDPQCASCNSTFVEKIEDPQDDPRAFQEAGPAWDDGHGGDAANLEWFTSLMSLLGNPEPGSRTTSPATSLPNQPNQSNGSRPTSLSSGGGMRFEFSRTGPGGTTRSVVIGGPNVLPGPGQRNNRGEGNIAGTLMAHYLLSMLNQRTGNHEDPFGGLLNAGAEDGRWGDYVFNQEALDQIVTQLMENSNASRPVPAPEDILNKLNREVLEEHSPLLERDCAVCKEQFSLTTEDPDEQVVVTLPCKHPFHETCITPWLKTSATCPVCRFQLVPQPNHEHPPTGTSPPRSPPRSNSSGAGNPAAGSGSGHTGMFGSLFNMLGGHHARNDNSDNPHLTSSASSSVPVAGQRRNSRDQSRRDSHDEHEDLPGGWVD